MANMRHGSPIGEHQRDAGKRRDRRLSWRTHGKPARGYRRHRCGLGRSNRLEPTTEAEEREIERIKQEEPERVIKLEPEKEKPETRRKLSRPNLAREPEPEIKQAKDRNEMVILASHHPSSDCCKTAGR